MIVLGHWNEMTLQRAGLSIIMFRHQDETLWSFMSVKLGEESS